MSRYFTVHLATRSIHLQPYKDVYFRAINQMDGNRHTITAVSERSTSPANAKQVFSFVDKDQEMLEVEDVSSV